MRKLTVLTVTTALALVLMSMPAAPFAAYAAGPTFWVQPSGDLSGATDWTNTMAAFDQAKAAGAGSTVRFAAGDFYFNQPIVVANFSGTARGQGRDVTRLHTAPGIEFPLPPYPLFPAASFMEFYLDGPTWDEDQTADVTVSDFAVYIDGPSVPYGFDLTQPHKSISGVIVRGIVWGYNDQTHRDYQISHMNATFRHLRLVAKTGPAYPIDLSSIYNSLWVSGEWVPDLDHPLTAPHAWVKPFTGAYVFQDIEIYNAANIVLSSALDSTIQVGGSPRNKVVVRAGDDAVFLTAVFSYASANSKVDVSYLDTAGRVGGVGVIHGAQGDDQGNPWPASLQPSSYVFHHNRIDSRYNDMSAFDLWNYGAFLGQSIGNVVISNNTINVVDQVAPFEGIFGFMVDNAQVTNNKITGRGQAAIWVGPFGTPATGWLLKGNNLKGFAASVAQIYLGPGTSNCTVVGGATKTSVLDEGTDNILVGVNNQHGNPPGPAIRDALEQKRATLRMLR